MADPERDDPRAELSQDELATVNAEAARLATRLDGWSRAAISRRLAEAVVDGTDMTSAVVRVSEELQTAPGGTVPIDVLEDVDRKEVSVEDQIEVLLHSDSPAIAQVGLIADESGQTKVTTWEKSNASWVEEGEQVRIHGAAKNWYEGRVSLAVTGWSIIHFPERGRWWEAEPVGAAFFFAVCRTDPDPAAPPSAPCSLRCARSHDLATWSTSFIYSYSPSNGSRTVSGKV